MELSYTTVDRLLQRFERLRACTCVVMSVTFIHCFRHWAGNQTVWHPFARCSQHSTAYRRGAVLTDRLDITDITIADGIDTVKKFSHQKGTSDGHRVQILTLPPNDVKLRPSAVLASVRRT